MHVSHTVRHFVSHSIARPHLALVPRIWVSVDRQGPPITPEVVSARLRIALEPKGKRALTVSKKKGQSSYVSIVVMCTVKVIQHIAVTDGNAVTVLS